MSRRKKPTSSPEGSSSDSRSPGQAGRENPPDPVPQVPKEKKSSWRLVRENIEAVGVAIVLALIIRHFSLEAFEIPTGSMAPGLNGVHVESTCPNCRSQSSIGIHTDSETGRPQVEWVPRERFYKGPCPKCSAEIDGLVGPKSTVDCAGCGPQSIDPAKVQTGRVAFFDAWCPVCHLVYPEVFEPRDVVAGHKILVNKFVRHLREPRRWEVIVFKFNRKRNYIKRLIGLPGEDIEIRDGDIWINSQIERKPEWAQDALWFPVHDSRRNERGMVASPAWSTSDAAAWRLPGFNDENREFRFNSKDRESRIAYERAIGNQYAYNAAAGKSSRLDGRVPTLVDRPGGRDSWRDWLIRDVRVEAKLTVDDGAGHVRLEVDNGPLRYRVTLPAHKGDREAVVELVHQHTQNVTVLATYPNFEPLRVAREYDLDFYLADRALTLRVDGTVVGQTNLSTEDPLHRLPPRSKATVGLSVQGITGRIARVQVFRDIHYTGGGSQFQHGTNGPFAIPEDAFFALGDNSPSSQDSRAWAVVPRQNLLGQAFWIFWPALPWRFQMGFIR